MYNLTERQIKDIAEQLELGFQAFFHKKNCELLIVPDTNRHNDMETSAWGEELDKLEDNFMDYVKMEAIGSSDIFKIMVDFTEELNDQTLRDKLTHALNKNKPFREFKYIIDASGEYRKKWFDFKNQRYIEWTKDQLNRLNEFINAGNASR